MSEVTITERDVNSFREKLDAWATTLTEGERAILLVLAARAFSGETDPEVAGFGRPGLFEVEDFSFDIEQATSIGSTSGGAGAGRSSQGAFGRIDSLVGSRVSGLR